jgi:hypothetical protein
MEEKFGLITGIECSLYKTDKETIESIARLRSLDPVYVKGAMRYNIFTINQFADLAGLSVSGVLNKTRQPIRNKEGNDWESDINFCYPFMDKENDGPKFVVRNSKSEKYIKV